MPGGSLPTSSQVIPVEGGGRVVLSPKAQQGAAAAQEFAKAYPEMSVLASTQGVRAANNLPQEALISLDELRMKMRMTPPKPATVINLHPWSLSFNYSDRLLRGIKIPECNPGQPYAYHHIRGYRTDWKYNDQGVQVFSEILPITLAAQFVRQFSDKDNDGGGVIIYEGESHPDKLKDVEIYDVLGRPITNDVPGIEEDPEGNKVPVMFRTAIKKNFIDVLNEVRLLRNKVYLKRVQDANRDYNLPSGKGKWNITDKHHLMAEVLFAEGVISSVPQWKITDRMEEGLSERNCPGCQNPTKKGAFRCSCGHILNPLAAYKEGAIPFEHGSMDLLTSDELEEALEVKTEREAVKAKAAASVKKGKKKESE